MRGPYSPARCTFCILWKRLTLKKQDQVPPLRFPHAYIHVHVQYVTRTYTIAHTLCVPESSHITIFRNPIPTSQFLGVGEDCCMFSTLPVMPSCSYSFWHGTIPTFILVIDRRKMYTVQHGCKLVISGGMPQKIFMYIKK